MRDSVEIKEWVKCFNAIHPKYDPQALFRDWAECFALSISNSIAPPHSPLWEKREKRYLEIVKRYDSKDVQTFPELCAWLTMAFESDPFDDYLGRIYMEIFGGNKGLGQCFTPIDVCEACAGMAVKPKDGEVQTLADECSGGGAMLIAACGAYHKAKVDYQRWLKITAGDLDKLCVHMTYIQLSMIGARAKVYHRDTLTRQCFDVFVTPMEILWPMKYGAVAA